MVNVIVKARAGFDVRKGEMMAILRFDKDGESTGEGSDAASFPCVDVGAGVCEDGMWGLSHMGTDGDLVAHCAREDKKGGFMASKVGNKGFERLSGWVFGEDVVEEGAIFDGAEHRWGRRSSHITYARGTKN